MNITSPFISIDEKLKNYSLFDLNEKFNLLRKLARNVTYNNDYQIKIAESSFIGNIIDDINQNINNKSLIDKENNDILTYIRLFFMFFHNELGNNSKYQMIIFNCVFEEKIDGLNEIITHYISDKKVQKFFLGALYKLYFLNTSILSSHLSHKHFAIFLNVINHIKFNVDITQMKNDKDMQEINDWIHIIFTYILKNDEICSQLNKLSFFDYIILKYPDNIIFFEIIRDIVDYSKESKILLISINHIKTMCNVFIENINIIIDILNNIDIISNYETLSSDNKDIIVSNRKILCLIDVFSVILTTEDLNNKDYRNEIFKEIANEIFYKKILNILTLTDKLYDTIFKRDKALKVQEKKLIPMLPESNIFFGFQTNIMKFLSNFSFKNESVKQFFIANQNEFYYLLNHIKIDKCNPFKKEWTVLMIKSLCENCYEIQKFIINLNPIEMDPLLKDYIINKGKTNFNTVNDSNKEIYFDYLTKKNK